MTIAQAIPLTPQPWNKNPGGYVYHQLKLKELVEWLEANGATVSLPEDTGTWDKGVDLYINGLPVDLKGFGLLAYDKTYTWDSSYYQGRPRPLWAGSLTQWFIHPTDGDPSTWIAAEVYDLHTSKYGHAPYYFKDTCIDMAEFIRV